MHTITKQYTRTHRYTKAQKFNAHTHTHTIQCTHTHTDVLTHMHAYTQTHTHTLDAVWGERYEDSGG